MYTEAEVSKLNNELENTGKKITALGNAKWEKLASVGTNLTKYVTAPIIGATTALGAFAVTSMQTADELYDNASKVYLSVEAYQEWAHACQILAVDQTQLQKAFVKTNALLGDIASGDTQKASEALGLIGLTVEDIAGLDTDQAFSKIRDALAECGDEATRTAVTNEIFGDKLGAELTQVLGATAEEIEALRQEARDLGIATTEQAEIAGEFCDAVDNMKTSLQSVGYEIGAIVVPILTKLCNLMINNVIPAIKNMINAWNELSAPVKGIIVALVGIATAIGPILVAVAKLIPMIKTLKTTFEGVNLVSMLAGKWWIALIAILAVILLQNEKFRELLGRIMSVLGQVIDTLMDLINEVLSALMPVIEIILDLVNDIINVLVDLINQILDPIIDIINLLIRCIQDIIPILQEIINKISNSLIPIIELLKKIMKPITEIIGIVISLVVMLVEAITGLIDGILGTLIEIITVIGDILGVVIDLISTLIDILVEILEPVLQIIMAILRPILAIVGVIIEVIVVLMEILTPLIDMFLKPITMILQVVFTILEALSPILLVLAQVIQAVIVPALEILYAVLEPILEILMAIIDAIKWVLDKIGDGFEWIGDLFGDIGDWFSDTFNIGGGGGGTTNNNTTNTTTNNITVNTTSPTIDLDSLNKKLGGSYL